MTGLPIDKAAAELQVSIPTLRRWLRAGCPQAARGRRGRGHRALVDPAAVLAWRAGSRPQGDVGQVLTDLQRDAQALAVDCCIEVLGRHSIKTATGAEHRLLHSAVADLGRTFADAVMQWAEEKQSSE